MITTKQKTIVVGVALLIVGLLVFDSFQAPKVSWNLGEAATSLSLLSQTDLQFAGAFVLPDDSCGYQLNGVTVRYENGVRHFLTRAGHGCGNGQNNLYDYLDPGSSVYRTGPPYVQAARPSWGGNWGKVGTAWAKPNQQQGQPCTQCAGIGLYWDEQDQKLYSNFADLYGQATPDPSVTQSVLDNTTHKGTDVGCFGFPGRNPAATTHGVAALPPWFVSQYLPAGERLVAGFGAVWESVSASNYSKGPSLISFVPPTNLAGCPNTSVSWVNNHHELSYYPPSKPAQFLGFPYARDAYGNWSSSNGHGWYNNTDSILQGCVPVWTDAVQGFLCLANKSDGQFDATILANPAPTMNSVRLSSTKLADGSDLIPGDGIELQIGPLGGQNCNGTSVDILVDTVNTSTGDITWKLASYGPVTSVPPIVGGFAKGSAAHYCHAVPGPMRVWNVFQSYDLHDYGKVAQGIMSASAPVAKSEWIPTFPNNARGSVTSTGPLYNMLHSNPYCGSNGSSNCGGGDGGFTPVGVTFDPVANQVIVVIRGIDTTSTFAHWKPGVFIYNVRTSSGFPTGIPPSVSLSASPTTITSGSSSTLTWVSTNATSCTASGAWSGTKSTSGTQSVSPTTNSTYTLSCTGTGGTAIQSVSITVSSGTTPGTLVGDLNNDKIVNSLDWSAMNSKWFTADANADLNDDGIVNSIDFSILNTNWFKTIP